MARMKALSFEQSGVGLPAPMVRMLDGATSTWIAGVEQRGKQMFVRSLGSPRLCEEKKEDSLGAGLQDIICGKEDTDVLNQVLSLHLSVVRMDPILAEELGRQGSHSIISRIIRFDLSEVMEPLASSLGLRFDSDIMITENDLDSVMELQELACEIASSSSGKFPLKFSPFSKDELLSRQPMLFSVKPSRHVCQQHPQEVSLPQDQLVLINQVSGRQSAQEDVGFVMWPSAVVLSKWLISNPQLIHNKRVLELGAGCGLVGLVAAGIASEQKREAIVVENTQILCPVVITDFNPKVLENLEQNICLNDLSQDAHVAKLDFYTQDGDNYCGGWIDGSGAQHAPVDVLLAADVICKPEDATAVANTIYDALKPGGMAILVSADSKHRFGVDRFESECARLCMSVTLTDVDDLFDRGFLQSFQEADGTSGIEATSGYVDDMKLTMYRVTKPSSR